ncbi:uncharacterized protein FYW61_006877 [Anableps anableps]
MFGSFSQQVSTATSGGPGLQRHPVAVGIFQEEGLLATRSSSFKVNMESLQERDVLLLVEKYCNLGSPPTIFPQTPALSSRKPSKQPVITVQFVSDSFNRSGSACKVPDVPRQLARIVASAPITEQNLQTQDEIIQRLIELLITFGDDINVKLKQNPALQKQLQNLNYNLFEKLTSTVQNLVAPSGWAAGSDGLVQKQRIAWAFEVTSRLSSVTVVHRRAIQKFGAQYIEENHADWVQQHGGWEEAFD